jgi:hypothetical protein
VTKDQPVSLRIDVQQPASLGGRQVAQLGVCGCALQHLQIAGAVQGGEQEQAACRGRQPLDARCEQLAQPAAGRAAYLADVEDGLASGWGVRGKAVKRLRATLGIALDFFTWPTLEERGVGRSEAVGVMSSAVRAVAATT